MCSTPYISFQMRASRCASFILSLILGLWTTGSLAAFSIGAGGGAFTQVAGAPGYGAKLQYGGGGSMEALFPLLPWLSIDAVLALDHAGASDPGGGFVCSGFLATGLSAGVQARADLATWRNAGTLGAGAAVSGGAALASYDDTTLYFFYPQASIGGFLDFSPSFIRGLTARLSVPVTALFRRDMEYTIRAGLALSVLYGLGAAR
jgi:hypothetical protein